MKKIWVIMVLLTLSLGAFADHLLGGEITYEHISSTQYKIHVTLFRDCNGSRLGGSGGGGTSDHLELKSIHVETVAGSACGSTSQYLGKLNLTKEGYYNVTKVCAGVKTACDNNSDFDYGIEAHKYYTVVNFDQFSSASGCDLKLYVSISDRTDDLTTLSGGTNFYNFAVINPWSVQVSSPKFQNIPDFIYSVNSPVRGNPLVTHNSGDSLSFKWASPLKASNDALTYGTGFSKDKFITAYCPGGDCTPDPDASIPEGIFLDEQNGNFAFTPTSYSQIGVMVLEVEQWRKVNGQMTMIGLVRQDAVLAVVLDDYNNAPVLNVNEEYKVCVGDKLEFTVKATDARTNIPGQGLQTADSVRIQIITSNAAIKDSAYTVGSAPYEEHVIRLQATDALIGTHYILITAEDNHCPKNGNTQRMVKITVNPLPKFDFVVEDKFCGNNTITLSSSSQGSASLRIQGTGVDKQFASVSSVNYINYKAQKLSYSMTFLTNEGCSSTITKEIDNKGNSTVESGTIAGADTYCEGDNMNLVLRHQNYSLGDLLWFGVESGRTLLSSDSVLNTPAEYSKVEVDYSVISNGLECKLADSKEITINKIPVISIDDPDPICRSERQLDLADISVSPSGGSWTATRPVSSGVLDITAVSDAGESIILTYTYEDQTSGCSASNDVELIVLSSPVIKLKDVVLCGASNPYRLTNSIDKPVHFTPEKISWELLGQSGYINGTHPLADLDIPSLGIGQFTIVGINTGDNGCVSTDTSWIRVDEGLTIEGNDNVNICQGSEPLDLVEFLEINAPGGMFTSLDAYEMLKGNMLTPVSCGTYQVDYTYDAFGCFAQKTFTLHIICRPDIELDVPPVVCENTDPVVLTADQSGTWSGNGVTENTFDPGLLKGTTQNLIFSTDPIGGCVFDKGISIDVIPAASVNVLDLPEHLCEGENLTFDLDKDANSTLLFSTCGTAGPVKDANGYIYVPTFCDLKNTEIRIQIEARINEVCPVAVTDISVPYSPLPRVMRPSPISECFPFGLEQSLQLASGGPASMTSTIVGIDGDYYTGGSSLDFDFPIPGTFGLKVDLVSDAGCENTEIFNDQYRIYPKPFAAFDISREGYINLSDRDIYLYNYSEISTGRMGYTWTYLKGGKSYNFSTASNPYYELPLDTGRYDLILTATSDQGCRDTAMKSVVVVPDMIIFVPTAFSPDETGPEVNNSFRVTCVNADQFHIMVFNKWGQMVYESYDINEAWDGTINNSLCPMGVYVYRIDIVNHSGITFQYGGTVNLLR